MKDIVENTINKLDDIFEGINDKNLFKAVILAGGPGSGKSFIGDMTLKGDMKFIASDVPFEMLLDKFDLPHELDIDSPEYDAQMAQREKAISMTQHQAYHWINGMLPVVLDGTGQNYDKIVRITKQLRELGYDVSMIFVETSLEVALNRQNMRKRKIDPRVATSIWNTVKENIPKYEAFFGKKDFHVVENNEYLEGSELEKLKAELVKLGNSIARSPLKNPKGKQLLDLMKKTKSKLLSDIGKDIQIKL